MDNLNPADFDPSYSGSVSEAWDIVDAHLVEMDKSLYLAESHWLAGREDEAARHWADAGVSYDDAMNTHPGIDPGKEWK